MQEKFNPTIIILSAGKGERIKSCTPKVLHNINSQSIIEYVAMLCSSLSTTSDHTYIVINHELQNNIIFQKISNKYKINEIIQKERFGTGNAVSIACDNIPFLNNVVLILYGDTPFIQKDTILNMYKTIQSGSDLCIVAFSAENPQGYGRIISGDQNKVLAIIEDQDATEKEKKIDLCASGIILIKKESLLNFLLKYKSNIYNLQHEFYFTDVVRYLNTQGQKCTYIIAEENEVMGVNDRRQLMYAEKYNQLRISNKLLDNGVTLINPETSYFANNIDIQHDVIIYSNVFIGNNSSIKTNSIIHSFSYIEGVEVGAGSIIGPFARIRGRTKIGVNSKIGNFVELKNSDLHDNIKASHLSYIGDTTIADNVNIGAGTVFCNYDGKDKHRSYIGKDVFIGSNSSIISPIIIHSNAVIAAGSVITKDVDKSTLAIARSKQISIPKKVNEF